MTQETTTPQPSSGREDFSLEQLSHLAVIIGAMRSGTSSLFHWLSQHPEICASTENEPGFFSNDDVWNRGLDWYQSLWKWDRSVHRIALEESDNYSKAALFPAAARRLASVAPNAKIIFAMRNPIHRIESHYTLGRAKGWPESGRPLKDYIHDDLLECSRYAKQIDQYAAVFPMSNILLLRSEEMFEHPARVLSRVCTFLGVENSYEFEGLTVKHSSNVGRRPGELGWLLYRVRMRIPFWRQIARRLSPRAIDAVKRVFQREGARNFELSEEQREQVLRNLAGDLWDLKEKYGFRVEEWRMKISPR